MSLITAEGVSVIDGVEVEWVAETRLVYVPARISGSMENSRPSESEEEILSIFTHPAGYESRIPESRISEAAWKIFDEQQRER